MTDKRRKALAIIENMLPKNLVEGLSPAPPTSFAADLGEIAMDGVFVPVWTRDGIDLRTRSLVTIAILIALRAHSELAIHVPAAIRNGATIAEIEEVIYQAAGYAGFPAAASARDVALEALTEARMLD